MQTALGGTALHGLLLTDCCPVVGLDWLFRRLNHLLGRLFGVFLHGRLGRNDWLLLFLLLFIGKDFVGVNHKFLLLCL